MSSSSLANSSVVVTGLRNFGISSLGNGYIEIFGSIIFKDGSKGALDLHMAFDKAIESIPGTPLAELIVSEELKTNTTGTVADEIAKLYKLYQDGVLNKEEFEAQKKKLLGL